MKRKLIKTNFCKKFNLRIPVIQASLAGGITISKLVSAVSNAGGLGSLPLGYLTLKQAKASILETKLLTKKPFCLNLFITSNKKITQNKKLKIANMQEKLKIDLQYFLLLIKSILMI